MDKNSIALVHNDGNLQETRYQFKHSLATVISHGIIIYLLHIHMVISRLSYISTEVVIRGPAMEYIGTSSDILDTRHKRNPDFIFPGRNILWHRLVINPFNPKYLDWYSPCLVLEHTILICRGERVNKFHQYIFKSFSASFN